MNNVSFYVPIFCFLCDQGLANCNKLRVHLKKLIVPQLLKIFSEILQKPGFRYHVNISPLIVPILCQINSDCAFTIHIRSIFNIILSSRTRTYKQSFYIIFLHKTLYSSPVSHNSMFLIPSP